MKRALFISDHGDPLCPLGGRQSGGQNVYVRELGRALGRLGWQVDVVTHHADPQTPACEKKDSLRVFRFSRGGPAFVAKEEMPVLLPHLFHHVLALAGRYDYKVIHTHYWMSGWLGLYLSNRLGLPLVHTSHSLGVVKERAGTPVNRERLEAERLILSFADGIVTTTEQEAGIVGSLVPGDQSGSRVEVIPAGVDAGLFNPRARESRRPPFLLFVGRPEKNKGLDVLLRAWRRLAERPELYVVGQHRRRPEPGLVCTGPLEHRDLARLYKTAAVTVVPSFYESFGLVAAEAMSCGCPVIASDVGGLGEIVVHGQTGLTFPPGDHGRLRESLVRVLSDPPLAARLGTTAAQRAARRFNWDNIGRQTAALYERLIRSPGLYRQRGGSFDAGNCSGL